MPLDYPPSVVTKEVEEFLFDEDVPTDQTAVLLGDRLARGGDLFRGPDYEGGLKLVVRGGFPDLRPLTRGATCCWSSATGFGSWCSRTAS